MKPPVTLMGTDENTIRSLKKVIESFFAEEVHIVPEYNNAKKSREMEEILVSKAMKLACNDNQKVMIVGVDRKRTLERDLKCSRFDAMIYFFPYPVSLPEIFSTLASFEQYKDFDCEKTCTVFGNRCRPKSAFGNLYAGEIIRRIGHDLEKLDPAKFLSAYPNLSLLKNLFVPKHGKESEMVQSYILEMRKLAELAEKSENQFREAAVKTLGDELFQNFPYFWGGE